MNVKTTVPLATAVVLGLVAAIVASQLVKQRPVAVTSAGEMPVLNLTSVVVAAHDISPGAQLTGDDLKVLRIESASVPANVATEPGRLMRRVAKMQIPAGTMIHTSMLAEQGVAGGLPGVITPGYRAMTIEINEFTGLAGLLEPGNHVDILARVAEAEGSGQMTRTIVQNVPIIAVGTQLTNKAATGETNGVAPVVGDAAQQKQAARSITVLVTPADAEKIDLASATNSARIVLRASTDGDVAAVAGATVASLRGSSAHAEVATAAATKTPADNVFGGDAKPAFRKTSTRSVTVIRAGVLSQVDVNETPATPPATDGQSASAD